MSGVGMRIDRKFIVKMGLKFSMLIVFIAMLLGAGSLFGADINQLQRSFEQPPDDARIMARWWWFGTAVTKPELEREMKMMKAGGFGGFEVQQTYPLALDGELPGVTNNRFL